MKIGENAWRPPARIDPTKVEDPEVRLGLGMGMGMGMGMATGAARRGSTMGGFWAGQDTCFTGGHAASLQNNCVLRMPVFPMAYLLRNCFAKRCIASRAALCCLLPEVTHSAAVSDRC
jgi:hypothetical protein